MATPTVSWFSSLSPAKASTFSIRIAFSACVHLVLTRWPSKHNAATATTTNVDFISFFIFMYFMLLPTLKLSGNRSFLPVWSG